jgi:hypothetical protein
VFNLFDGHSDAQTNDARTQWKVWGKNSALELGYFIQSDDGRWRKNA